MDKENPFMWIKEISFKENVKKSKDKIQQWRIYLIKVFDCIFGL